MRNYAGHGSWAEAGAGGAESGAPAGSGGAAGTPTPGAAGRERPPQQQRRPDRLHAPTPEYEPPHLTAHCPEPGRSTPRRRPLLLKAQ